MPNLRRENLQWLTSQLEQNLCVMLRRGGRVEPFPSAFRIAAADLIEQQLTSGVRAMHQLFDLPNFASVEAPRDWPDKIWMNLNSPADLQEFLKSHGVE